MGEQTMSRAPYQVCATAVIAGQLAMLAAQAPIPKLLREAKRIYLVNAGTQPKVVDDVAKRLRDWGRFSLVDSRSDADIVIAVADSTSAGSSAVAAPIGGGFIIAGGPAKALAIQIRSPQDPDPLYTDVEEHGVGRDEIKNPINRLCYRLEAERAMTENHPCRSFGSPPK
jgi:hypothetical protein